MANTNYKNAISTFYILKNNYDKGVKDKNKSCVLCGKSDGTIFTTNIISTDSFYGRRLSAICGCVKKPCNLNIQIDISYFSMFQKEIKDYIKTVNDHKKNIIMIKNNNIFYGDEEDDDSIKNFSSKTSELKEDMQTLITYQSLFKDSISRPDVSKKEVEMNNLIQENKQLLSEYKISHKEDTLNTIMINYNVIQELSGQIRKSKYSRTYMEKEDDKYVLNQNVNSFEDFISPKDSEGEYNIRSFDVKNNTKDKKQKEKKKE